MCDFVATKIPGGFCVSGNVQGRAPGQYVLVMDTSGSMGAHACEILKTVGKTIARAGIPSIDIITFSHVVAKHKAVTPAGFADVIGQYRNLGNSTRMEGAIASLAEYAGAQFVTIIVISDGELHDRPETMRVCERMRGTFERTNTSVFAIRLYTSRSSPETVGLAGVMTMGNVHGAELIDVDGTTAYHDTLSAQLESIMGLPCVRVMSTEERLAHSATSIGVKTVVTAGVFYVQGPALPPMWIGGRPVDIPVVTQSIGVYLDHVAGDIEARVRLARVAGNKQECEAILAHIRQAEAELALEETTSDALAASRVRRAIADARRVSKGLSGRLAEIANNDRVSAMNAQQCADYLRTATNTRLARATASRQMTDDVTTAIVAELRNLAKNVTLMPDDDDEVSTISQLSTAESFRDIFANIEDIGSLNAAQILELIGIVGLAACGRVGDYPDPMCYKLDASNANGANVANVANVANGANAQNQALYTHMLYSCGDLMQSWRWAAERHTDPPRAVGGGEITAVIPLLTPAMQAWIMRYAYDPPSDAVKTPILLEVMAGVSMRRMIGAVPQTYMYLLVAGYWELILAEPTELVTRMLARLRALLDPFRHYWDWMKPAWTPGRMCWIGNNGLSNMLVFAHEDDPLIAHIVHSAFSFDAYQLVRKRSRPENTNMTRDEFAAKALCGRPDTDLEITGNWYRADLLQWNIETLEWKPCDAAIMSWINHPHWKNAVGICAHFGVVLSTQQQFGYLVQSLKYWEKKLRVRDNQHPFDELATDEAANAQITSVLSEYSTEILARRKKERRTSAMAAALTMLLTRASMADREQFCRLLKDGLVIPWEDESLHVMITPMNVTPLIQTMTVDEKLKILVSGKYRGETVWNNGNVLRRHVAFRRFKADPAFIAMMREIGGGVHVYRNSPNRHGHSNDKPSYYAYGFDSIEQYRDGVSAGEWADYCAAHKGCCGL